MRESTSRRSRRNSSIPDETFATCIGNRLTDEIQSGSRMEEIFDRSGEGRYRYALVYLNVVSRDHLLVDDNSLRLLPAKAGRFRYSNVDAIGISVGNPVNA